MKRGRNKTILLYDNQLNIFANFELKKKKGPAKLQRSPLNMY